MLRFLPLALLFLLPVVHETAAQTLGAAPAGGGFGRGGSSSGQSLDFTLAVAGALDSTPPPELRRQVGRSATVRGGVSSMVMGGANYAWTQRRVMLDATASSAARHYPSLGRVLPMASGAAAGLTFRPSPRSSLGLRQSAAYSPSYLFRLFPNVVSEGLEESLAAAPDYRIDDRESFAYVTRATFQTGTRRGHALTASAERSRTDFTNAGTLRPNRDFVGGSAGWTQRVGRNGSLSTGYEYREGVLGLGGRATEHRLRGGGGYSFALSGTRRLGLRFNVAPSMIERRGLSVAPATSVVEPGDQLAAAAPDAPAVSALLANSVRYRLEADATLTYPFLRSWNIAAGFQRRMQYIPILQDPVFSSAGQIMVQGLVTRRLDASVSAGYAQSQSAFRRSGRQFETYQGRASLRFALARSVAVYGEYLQYYYDLRRAPELAPDIPSLLQQRGVRVGLMFWGRAIGR